MTPDPDIELLRDDIIAVDPFRLVGTRCRAYAHVSFPRRDFCPTCHTLDVEDHDLPAEGVLESFTTVRQAPPGIPVPYMLGFVSLPGPVQLLARIASHDHLRPEIGSRVVAVPHILENAGVKRLAYAFELVEEDEQ